MTKTSPSLRDIEKAMYQLWSRKEKRARFLAGDLPEDLHPALHGHIDERGVRLYSSLMEIGRQDLMSSIYPYTKQLTGKAFSELVNDYFEKMPPQHFNLNQSARRFPDYIRDFADKQMKRYPFLSELAEYEWLELAVMEDDVQIKVSLDRQGEVDPIKFAAAVPILNPTLVTRAYKYPISDIIEKIESGEKLPRRQRTIASWTLFFRCPQEEHCRYLHVGELTYELVLKMSKNLVGRKGQHCNYGELITFAVSGMTGDANENVSNLLELIEDLKDQGLIIGEI